MEEPKEDGGGADDVDDDDDTPGGSGGGGVVVVDADIEHRAGDHFFDCLQLSEVVLATSPRARYVRFEVTENFGGSGTYISKCYVFGTPASPLAAGP